MEIKFHRKPQLDNAVMLAGWPGMGSVAVDSINFIRRKLNAKFFAEICTRGVYTPESVTVEKGIASLAREPVNLFYYRKNPPVVFLEGTHQFTGQDAYILVKKTLDIAREANVSKIITSAAFPAGMNHYEASRVFVAANNNNFLDYFSRSGLKPLKGGQISGLNGMLLGYAKTRGIDAACLLATIPQYAVGIPNPRAVIEVADIISRIINVEIDLFEIEDMIEVFDRKMESMESNIKDIIAGAPAETERPPEMEDIEKIPESVLARIEKMFTEVKQDKKKASMLKAELDRWDLYRIYEDRFLDLFKETY